MRRTSYRKIIFGNVSWIIVADLFNYLVGFLFIIYFVRKIGDYQYGIYNFAKSFESILFTFTEIGAGMYFARRWSTDVTNLEEEWNLLNAIKCALSALLFGGVLLYGFAVHGDIVPELVLFFLILFVNSLRESNNVYFTSQNRFRYKSVALILERGISVVLGFILLALGCSLRAYLGGYLLAILCSYLYQFRHLQLKFHFPRGWGKYAALGRRAMPFLFFAISYAVYTKIDTVMIQFFSGYRPVGWYNAAYAIVNVFNFFPAVIFMAMFPSLRQLYHHDPPKLVRLYNKTVKFLLVAGVPMAIGIAVLSPRIIALIYPAEFSPAVSPLAILIVAEVFVFLNAVCGTLLVCLDKERIASKIIASTMVLNIVLNLFFIPRWSISGAAAATLIAEIVYFLLMYGAIPFAVDFTFWPYIAANGMLLWLLLFACYQLPLFLLIAIGAAVYIGSSLFIFRSIGRDDLALLFSSSHPPDLRQ
ncbi:MAG: flippase [Patescibacteria group bacterium]|nr:flippase [Patescibacteria group bacterium]